jgi:hypothetical protein
MIPQENPESQGNDGCDEGIKREPGISSSLALLISEHV